MQAKMNHTDYFLKFRNFNDFESLSLNSEGRIITKLYSNLKVEIINKNNLEVLAIEVIPQTQVEFSDLKSVVYKYQNTINVRDEIVDESKSFDKLAIYFAESVDYFRAIKVFDKTEASDLLNRIQMLASYFRQNRKVICHGDLSSRNLYKFSGTYIALDWEDCFWGFEGFDEIYWLTFIENISSLKLEHISKIDLPIELAKSCYLAIVVAKEFIHRGSRSSTRLVHLKERMGYWPG